MRQLTRPEASCALLLLLASSGLLSGDSPKPPEEPSFQMTGVRGEATSRAVVSLREIILKAASSPAPSEEEALSPELMPIPHNLPLPAGAVIKTESARRVAETGVFDLPSSPSPSSSFLAL